MVFSDSIRMDRIIFKQHKLHAKFGETVHVTENVDLGIVLCWFIHNIIQYLFF